MTQPKIPGIVVSMGGEEWTVPPLTLGQLRRLMPKINGLKESISVDMTPDHIATVAEIVAAALSRNYPDVDARKVEDELLDLGNANEVLVATLTGSRPQKTGEAKAVASPDGPKSTVSLPPLADTPETPSTN
jgi:hypothetical protein